MKFLFFTWTIAPELIKKENVRSPQVVGDLIADSGIFCSTFSNCLLKKTLILKWKKAQLLIKKGRARSPQLADKLLADSGRF